jgi:hypothetical protein
MMEGLHISNFLKIQSEKIQEYCTRDGNGNEYMTILYICCPHVSQPLRLRYTLWYPSLGDRRGSIMTQSMKKEEEEK